ncbi:hypothetical protein PHYSODRAFT_258196 [Phytophthora sojae]|uniref:Uncharacterized protein n=1 Tax=Phytophthora sojae (strain P6497) TaxID=1094619 RepID=G5ABV2_PHYSP|nr:hypothetical protein PHYSODRAFT_258196 [Phytophthora sojae]EGZ06827.1 hypothetical protein PHYSODRAFT_258196 [Phytophthora sojae]|eukprot:XP_009537591.1 hypothetical protein PHYSODRAFT_258196 [Phytophthora sojae]
MQYSGGPGSAPPFTFPDLGPVVQNTSFLSPAGHVVDLSAPASEASAASTPAFASASGVPRRSQASAAVPVASVPSSGAGGSAGAAPSPTPASAEARGVAGGLQAAPSVIAHHASAASTGETSASSAVAPTLPTPALPSASGASSDPACTQLVLRSSPDSSPLHEPSSNAAHFCRTGDPLPATAHEALGLIPRSSAQWYAVEDIVHHEVQAEVEELREHSERRFANFAQLMIGLHPYNTTFAPCNPRVPLFVPRGMTVREVATAITVNPVLDSRRVTAPWVREFTNFHGPPFGLQEDGQPGEDEVSEEEEVEELIEAIESPVAEESSEEARDESRRVVDTQATSGEATQALGAQDAATATEGSAQDRVAASEAPLEEAPASETPADAPRSPPSAADQAATQAEASPAARLRVLAKVASSSDA